MARKKSLPKKHIAKTTTTNSRPKPLATSRFARAFSFLSTSSSSAFPISPTMTSASPALSPPDVYVSSKGVKGEVLRFGSEDGADGAKWVEMLFLPGNPGVIEMYRSTLRELSRASSPGLRVSVHGLGLPGHDFRALNGTSTYRIADHHEYVCEYIRNKISSIGEGENHLVLVGHSYGAYLAMKLSAEFAAGNKNVSLFLLMPCVENMKGGTGWFSGNVLKDPYGVFSAMIGNIARWIPPNVLFYNSCASDMAMQSIASLMRNAGNQFYRNISALAVNEMAMITNVPHITIGNERRKMLWCADDKWCPESTVNSLDKLDFSTEKVDGVEHAFCLNEKQVEIVVQKMTKWINEVVNVESQ